MKIYGKEIPQDIEIPELDAETIAGLDALHRQLAENRRQWDEFNKANPPTPTHYANRPVRQLGIDFDAFRKLPPRTRAIILYVRREFVTA